MSFETQPHCSKCGRKHTLMEQHGAWWEPNCSCKAPYCECAAPQDHAPELYQFCSKSPTNRCIWDENERCKHCGDGYDE